ncbi:purine phosphorylase [Parasphingorhabdus sp.]|jgi:adenosylhomocysteine nucleosidase|uniref:5'-methylthioadenosine/S-adenosylhomocysteine nucleosidase family protein n=1 Tax=Parasphingorhabdus sp. TaxID=2709688 RepID=UPI003BAF463A
MSNFQKIALITGVADEADAFLPDHPSEVEPTPLGTVRHVTYEDKQIAILCPGIGKVHAAAAAMHLHNHFAPNMFLIIGTAGQVSNLDGNCFYLREAFQADYGTLENSNDHEGFTCYNAGAWPMGPANWTPFTAHPMPTPLALPQARIATADTFVKCPDRSTYLRDSLNADLVDMETAALAQVAQLLNLPWAGIKATTDNANGESSGDFHANLAAAAQRAADAAVRFLAFI